MAVLALAKNPVLAHHFLNFMLDNDNAYANFYNFVGYQPPLNSLNPDLLVSDEVVPAHLDTTVVRRGGLRQGYTLLELSPRGGRAAGRTIWARVQSRRLMPGRAPRCGIRAGFGASRHSPGSSGSAVFFLVPFYTILAVAIGTVGPDLPRPAAGLEPARVGRQRLRVRLRRPVRAGRDVLRRLRAHVRVRRRSRSPLSLAIGYPVAYYIARHGGRWKALLLVGLVAPFWISYLMRMLAWVNLLQDDGYVNACSCGSTCSTRRATGSTAARRPSILGLVYGYVPFLILPLYAALDRIDRSLLEAARDLGASRFQTFRRVTLPLSKRRGSSRARDHRAADVRRLLHARPAVRLAEHEPDREPDQPLHPRAAADGRGAP